MVGCRFTYGVGYAALLPRVRVEEQGISEPQGPRCVYSWADPFCDLPIRPGHFIDGGMCWLSLDEATSDRGLGCRALQSNLTNM